MKNPLSISILVYVILLLSTSAFNQKVFAAGNSEELLEMISKNKCVRSVEEQGFMGIPENENSTPTKLGIFIIEVKRRFTLDDCAKKLREVLPEIMIVSKSSTMFHLLYVKLIPKQSLKEQLSKISCVKSIETESMEGIPSNLKTIDFATNYVLTVQEDSNVEKCSAMLKTEVPNLEILLKLESIGVIVVKGGSDISFRESLANVPCVRVVEDEKVEGIPENENPTQATGNFIVTVKDGSTVSSCAKEIKAELPKSFFMFKLPENGILVVTEKPEYLF